jgi:hypothetical protein
LSSFKKWTYSPPNLIFHGFFQFMVILFCSRSNCVMNFSSCVSQHCNGKSEAQLKATMVFFFPNELGHSFVILDSKGAHNKHKVWNLVLNINGQSPNLELIQHWKFIHLHANINATNLQSSMQCYSVHLPKAQGDYEIRWT